MGHSFVGSSIRRHTDSDCGSDLGVEEESDSTNRKSAKFAVARELAEFAEHRKWKTYKTRKKTVTVGLKSVLRDGFSQAQIENVLTTIEQHSLALGILRHIAGLFLNLLASQDPDCDLLFRRTFVQQLFAYIASRGMEKRRNLLKHPLLDSFLRENPIPDHLHGVLKNFPARSADYMAGAMMVSLKETVTRNFQERIEEHAVSLLERAWWNEHRSHELFEDVSRKGGRIICAYIRQSDDTVAEKLLEHFLSLPTWKKQRHSSWRCLEAWVIRSSLRDARSDEDHENRNDASSKEDKAHWMRGI